MGILPNRMDAPGGPVCACGKPSRRESGQCEDDHGGMMCACPPATLAELLDAADRLSAAAKDLFRPTKEMSGDEHDNLDAAMSWYFQVRRNFGG